MLPDSNDGPSLLIKPPIRVSVARHIRGDLLAPPFSIGLGCRSVVRTGVPKTSVNEDRDPKARIGNVRSPPHSRQGIVDAKPVTHAMECRVQHDLGSGVSPPLIGHPAPRVLRAGRRTRSSRLRRSPPHLLSLPRSRAALRSQCPPAVIPRAQSSPRHPRRNALPVRLPRCGGSLRRA